MYKGFVDFRQALDKITDPEVFKCQKEIKEITLCKRRLELEAEDKLDRENMEREARHQGIAASSSALQLKEKGKAVIEIYGSGQSSQELEVIERGKAFKLGLAKLNSQLRTYVEEAEVEPEKKKTQLVVVQTKQIPQQVAMDQQGLEIVAPILQE